MRFEISRFFHKREETSMDDTKHVADKNDHYKLQHYIDLTEKLETIIEFSTDGLYVVDSDGMTIFVNQAYEKMTGYSRDEFLGQNVATLTAKGYFNKSISKLVFEQKKKLSMIQKIGNTKKIGEKIEVVSRKSTRLDQNYLQLKIKNVLYQFVLAIYPVFPDLTA